MDEHRRRFAQHFAAAAAQRAAGRAAASPSAALQELRDTSRAASKAARQELTRSTAFKEWLASQQREPTAPTARAAAAAGPGRSTGSGAMAPLAEAVGRALEGSALAEDVGPAGEIAAAMDAVLLKLDAVGWDRCVVTSCWGHGAGRKPGRGANLAQVPASTRDRTVAMLVMAVLCAACVVGGSGGLLP